MLPCSFCLVSPVQRPHAQLPQAWRCWCCRDTFSWWLNVAEPLPAVSAGSWAAPGEPPPRSPAAGSGFGVARVQPAGVTRPCSACQHLARTQPRRCVLPLLPRPTGTSPGQPPPQEGNGACAASRSPAFLGKAADGCTSRPQHTARSAAGVCGLFSGIVQACG